MVSRLAFPAIVAASALMAGTAISPSVVGTISSTGPITINGSEMSPSVAPSWPLAANDEISTSAPALLQTAGRDAITLDANTKARIAAAGNGLEYIYLRQGGLHFDARTGPIYICVADHLYIPAKSARGSLRLNASGAVDSRLERAVFAEQGARACGPDVSADFLSGLPKAAGGSIGGAPGGISTDAKITIGMAIGAGAATVGAPLATSSSFSPACTSQNGCNFNPTSISPSQP